MHHQDTIAAIATPVGSGGIGIIRISGPQSLNIIEQFFRSSSRDPLASRSHRLRHGIIYDPRDGSDLDEALVAFMKGPHSYTGEDTVEINCHSGLVLLGKILQLILARGARPAEPGEFTRRAFLNGRMDLSQAEAVIDIIEAKSELGLKLASRQLTGRLTLRVEALRRELIDITATVEAAIDFPEDDILLDADGLAARIEEVASAAEALCATFHDGCLYKNGIQAVIAGKPNVGKSSILNALVGDERALVTPVPGTTRDSIEDTITIAGVPVHLIDTAGLHQSDHEIECLGMQRARLKISQADIILLVLDATRPLDREDDEVAGLAAGKKLMLVMNKTDAHAGWAQEELLERFPSAQRSLATSALRHTGIEELKASIARAIGEQPALACSDILIANARHRYSLEQTLAALKPAAAGFLCSSPPELIAVDLHAALDSLGEITGAVAPDDILAAIFSRFCIGK